LKLFRIDIEPMKLLSSVISKRRKTFFHWVDRRNARSRSHLLNNRNLFIFPSKKGLTFLMVAAVLWVLGTNYQNNLILALVFFMLAFFVCAILMTFANMSKLKVEYLGTAEAFAGDSFHCHFAASLQRGGYADAIEFCWQNMEENTIECAFESASLKSEFSVSYFHPVRGILRLPRLRIQSYFPFGLIRCWTWLNFDATVMVYPKPINGRLGASVAEGGDNEGVYPVQGSDDFYGLREYEAGDNLRHISWKNYARGRGLYVKQFSQSVSRENWLDFDTVAANGIEEKLSILCFWILQLYQREEPFGLKLPDSKLKPGQGFNHRSEALGRLAAFQSGAAK